MCRTIIICATVLLLASTAACARKSQDQIADECLAAMTATSSLTRRPAACDGLSDRNYRDVLMYWHMAALGYSDDSGDSSATATATGTATATAAPTGR